jgi:diguanylate cyclase (GGDEF)-like protein
MAALGLAALFIQPVRALQPEKSVTQYLQSSWNTSSGLPESSVNAITQTVDGYLWFGTQEGLARFDGVRFTVFTHRKSPGLGSDYIQTLAADRDGSLWIGTDSGLSHYRPSATGSKGTFELLTSAGGLAGNSIAALCQDAQGALWVGTDRGLSRIRSGRIQSWSEKDGLPDPGIRGMVIDARGSLWIATDKGLSRLENGRFFTFTKHDGLPNTTVTALAAGPDGSVWVATLADHLAQIKNGRIMTSIQKLPWNEVTALHADRNGTLWISFDHHGIGRISGHKLDLYGASAGLPSNRCSNALFEDREGSLWIGLLDAGVAELRDGKFMVFGKPEGLSGDYIDGVLEARDGSMWIAADTEGLNHLLPNGRVEHWNEQKGLPGQEVYSIAQTREGSIWAGYKRGTLARIRNGKVSIYRDPSSSGTGILSLFQDNQGRLLVGYGGMGLAQFENGRFHPITRSGIVRAIVQSPDGAIWLGLDGDGVERRTLGGVRRFTRANGLADDHVLSVTADNDGTIWVGTSGGLSRIRQGHVVTWSPDQGLPDSAVGSVTPDNIGNLWVGGDSGILRIARAELNGLSAGRLHPVVYSTADGLRTRETLYGIQPSVWKSRDGRLWFSTISGAAVIDPAHIPVNHVVPPVWIEHVTFNGHPVSLQSGIRVGRGSGNLEVTFTAPSFVAPQHVRFRYWLDGFDSDWVYTADRTSWYTNLPPGHYTFHVEAANSDGIWNLTGASFSFVLRPLPSRTPLAYVAYAAAALLLAWGFITFRIRHLVRRQMELTQLIAERTAQLESEKTALEAARHELHIRATHDSLTGLLNRAAILEHLQRELARSARENSPLAVVLVDLDHFKSLNDNYGHLCGDDAIREAADRFRLAMRSYDLAGRYGGEEFLILLPGFDPAHAPERIEELLDAIRSRPFTLGQTQLRVTCSIGVASFNPRMAGHSVREVLTRADAALYEAKRAGRNCSVLDLCIAPVPQ